MGLSLPENQGSGHTTLGFSLLLNVAAHHEKEELAITNPCPSLIISKVSADDAEGSNMNEVSSWNSKGKSSLALSISSEKTQIFAKFSFDFIQRIAFK